MINDLQSYYSISQDCPKCGNRGNGRAIKYEGGHTYFPDETNINAIEIPEHLIWTCKTCGFIEKSKTMDDSK